ncbi:M20 family metallopeptidase [Bacillus carboniphilus]|uniref:M20 family metallopeptidase n=1 Tax=Bacillus carboniphilus TaxID=86663 RepID=A0ABY9JXY2_9BACI|nr:M20 family metallopeptidase [Bacillus carboniphilus]WLR44239.1 M20 family metallopeptidase [Bacillus carboniphilus]
MLDDLYEEMVNIRRYLHQYPELSFQEVETAKFIADYHRKLGLEVREGVGGRGVVAKLKGNKHGKTVALRADFDALPIQEERDVPYKSKNDGVMHACGHDGHTATLLSLAKAFVQIKEDLAGTIVFIHQHAEELTPGGAIAMIEDGCLEGVDVIFGTHLWATEPYGEILYREGPLMAAADSFNITILGEGGHGAQPHLTKDSIVIASQLVQAIQQIVSRRINPLDSAVVSIGSFVSENAFNVIADQASLQGTVRTFNEEVRGNIEKELEKIIEGTCLSHQCDYQFSYNRGYPSVVNHKEETEHIKSIAKMVPEVTKVCETEPSMGGEDFAYYLEHVKGCFFFTGAQDPNWDVTYPHHHPKFSIDERAMLIASKTLGAATLCFLKDENQKA